MALFNYANREITAKVVYYGPGVCGKTTSLQHIHERIAPAQRGRLLSLATETDRTIFFDLLPLKLGEIRGFKLRFQLYTVPGQVKYNKTRKLVLQGADAIVFVADSHPSKRKENIESFRNLQENLKEQGKKLEELPIVYEYNKRDLPELLSMEDLNRDLNPRGLPHFGAVATKGVGVMETLEAISKLALQDIEARLGATTETESADTDLEEEFAMSDEELLDLTSAGESPAESVLTFASDDSDALQLDAEPDRPGSSAKPIETKPIGYDNNIPLEEVEISEDVAHTGSLKESEFFNLQAMEEQALRELDEFIGGAESEEESFGFDSFAPAASRPAAGKSAPPANAQANVFDFDFADGAEAEPADDASDLDFSFDAGGMGQAADDGEGLLDTADMETFDADNVLDFNLGEDAADNDNALDFAYNAPEDAEAETAPVFTLPEEDAPGGAPAFTADEDELLEFTLDDEAPAPDRPQSPFGSAAKGEIEPLNLADGDLDMSFGAEEPEAEALLRSGFAMPDGEPYDFRITDSVRFEMQHSEEISSVTPFEKQLDALSEDMFTAEEALPEDAFEPETAASAAEESFQVIADETTRLAVLAKHFYQHGETYRAKQTSNDNVLASLMYYTAIETALKAAALKYETCNPAVASLKIILDSIEEETGKTISGKKSIMDNIVKLKDHIQLETAYPDEDACELAGRICDRFLSTFAQEFLAIDFTALSPVLAKGIED